MSPSEGHGLPWKELLIPQIVNFSVFLIALLYLIKKPLRAHFSGKSQEFEEQKKKAEESRVRAENQNVEVRNQMKLLEETAGSSLDSAKKESHELKEKMVNVAMEAAKKINEESEKMVEFELLRAVSALKLELIQNSTKMAAAKLEAEVNENIQTRLNDDFISKAQVSQS